MTVLVGVRRSADSRTAIRLAAQEARYRDTTLIAVMAYPAERGWSPAVRHGAERANAQLIVLAARQGMSKVLGTVSQYVLRNAPCPVLTVPEISTNS